MSRGQRPAPGRRAGTKIGLAAPRRRPPARIPASWRIAALHWGCRTRRAPRQVRQRRQIAPGLRVPTSLPARACVVKSARFERVIDCCCPCPARRTTAAPRANAAPARAEIAIAAGQLTNDGTSNAFHRAVAPNAPWPLRAAVVPLSKNPISARAHPPLWRASPRSCAALRCCPPAMLPTPASSGRYTLLPRIVLRRSPALQARASPPHSRSPRPWPDVRLTGPRRDHLQYDRLPIYSGFVAFHLPSDTLKLRPPAAWHPILRQP